MDLRQEKKRREDFLVMLWEMHAGNYGGDQSTKELCKRIGLDYDTEGSIVGQYLYRAELVKWSSFDWISLTAKGIQEAERIVEARHEEIKNRVLVMIHNLNNGNTSDSVDHSVLSYSLGMPDGDVIEICRQLSDDNLIFWMDAQAIYLTVVGVHTVESMAKSNDKGRDTYNLHIDTIHGGVQQGSGNVQNIQINQTNNPEFDQAITGLLQIIQAAKLPNDEIEELRGEVEKLNRLAFSEPKPDSLEKAKFRFDKAKLTFEGAKLLVEAAPYLHTAWEFLKLKFGG